ncbi:tetratricopeptide repeat protein [Roseateles sp. P5_E7]
MASRYFTRNLVLAAALCLGGALAQAADGSQQGLFKRLTVLAPAGNAEVAYHLGMFLNNGVGTAKDNKAAFKYFLQAAEAGNELAAFKVGCYYAGQFSGVVPVDPGLALKYKLRAAEAGYDLAQQGVGAHYGRGGDLAQALVWFDRASRQGDLSSTALLARHFAADASPDKVKGLALMQLLKERAPKPSPELEERIQAVEAELTPEQRAAAASIKSTWGNEPTPLTRQARNSGTQLSELLASLEK